MPSLRRMRDGARVNHWGARACCSCRGYKSGRKSYRVTLPCVARSIGRHHSAGTFLPYFNISLTEGCLTPTTSAIARWLPSSPYARRKASIPAVSVSMGPICNRGAYPPSIGKTIARDDRASYRMGGMSTIGDRVRERRTELRMSQYELADLVGVTQPTIVDLERGRSKSTRFILELADALGLMPRWLKHEKGPKYAPSAKVRRRVEILTDAMEKAERDDNEGNDEPPTDKPRRR
jgi:transcriptional regulator with XRE-family HTH domain